MKSKLAVVLLVSMAAISPGALEAQAPAAQAGIQVLGTRMAGDSPLTSYGTMYCAGFITDRDLEQKLFIVAGEEPVRTQFIPGDFIYLSRGAGWIVNPNGEYMVLRRMVDVNKREKFPGQHAMLRQLGAMYAEVGRLRVNIVNDQTVTAEVLHACDPLTLGDIAVPFNVKEVPSIANRGDVDRFAPPTGKVNGIIAEGKEHDQLLAEGSVAYLSIGGRDGVQLGQFYRVFRPFAGNPLVDLDVRYRNEYPRDVGGQRVMIPLNKAQKAAIPRTILGEMVIIRVEGKSATGLVTKSLREMQVGDYVELQ